MVRFGILLVGTIFYSWKVKKSLDMLSADEITCKYTLILYSTRDIIDI